MIFDPVHQSSLTNDKFDLTQNKKTANITTIVTFFLPEGKAKTRRWRLWNKSNNSTLCKNRIEFGFSTRYQNAIGYFWLDETFSLWSFFGGVVIVAGMAMTNLLGRTQKT